MKNFEKIFWAIIIAVGLWAAATPGRQIPSAVPDRYRISRHVPPYVFVALFLGLGYMLFLRSR